MGTGQFCTNPGVVVIPSGSDGNAFVCAVAERFGKAAVGTMLSEGVRKSFDEGIRTLVSAGAKLVVGGQPGGGRGISFANTLLTTTGTEFVKNPAVFQTEAFGNGSLFVLAESVTQMTQIAESMEGNLTGCLYTDTKGSDDADYGTVAAALRTRVGRLLNDKMPTGVAVSPAMNHGGPFPATGHPGFTAVGLPASICRFAMLQSFDNIRPARLPDVLKDKNPNGSVWRQIDGSWTTADV